MKSKGTTKAPARRPRRTATGPKAEIARHRAQCRICRHAQREEIEQEFLDWVPAREIAETYKLGSHRAVYRHAHALGLFRMRRGCVERVLDNILERSGEAKITAAAVVSAIRLMIDLRSSGDWIYLKALRSPLPAPSHGAATRPPDADDEDASEKDRKKRAATSGYATGAAGPDDADAYSRLWASASPQLRRALKAPPAAEPPQTRLMIADSPPEKSQRNAAPKASAPEETGAKAEPPKPPAPPRKPASADPSPARSPAAPEPGTRQEPDGPPQVAGMAWPWPKGRSPFARRGRWRGRPVVG